MSGGRRQDAVTLDPGEESSGNLWRELHQLGFNAKFGQLVSENNENVDCRTTSFIPLKTSDPKLMSGCTTGKIIDQWLRENGICLFKFCSHKRENQWA